jgi:cation:H+ antiporter
LDLSGLGLPLVALVFVAAAVAIWIAGLFLSRATDALDDRLHLGQALGGAVLLAVAGTLPELAITVSAALNDNLPMAAGNLIGGIAMQTLVLVICDFAVRGLRPLSYRAAALVPVIEAIVVVIVVAVMLMGTLLPESATLVGSISPASIGIVIVWFIGLMVLNRMRNSEAWRVNDESDGEPAVTENSAKDKPADPNRPFADASLAKIVGVFGAASLVTLVAGVLLERSGDSIATSLGVNGVLFGATVLAAASALPEISTGIAAVRLGDYQLAMGDIFGGNSFQLTLFLIADILAGQPALPQAGAANAWLGVMGIAMTMVYASAILLRPKRRYARLGLDSILVVVIYIIGMIGFVLVAT